MPVLSWVHSMRGYLLHELRFEKRLMRYLEDLIREMDRKIAKAKDRADKESMPKPIKPEDQVGRE